MTDTVVVETSVAEAPPEVQGGTMDILGDAPVESAPVDSLFSNEVHTTKKAAEAKKPPEGEKAEKAKGTEGKPDKSEPGEKEAEPPAPKESEEDGKPPKGYVPHQALVEAREKVKEERRGRLAAEEKALAAEKRAAELAAQKKPQAAEVDPREERFKDFKQLSREEFRALQEDDPTGAQDYLFDLDEYRIYQTEKRAEEDQKKQAIEAEKRIEQARKEIVSTAVEDMKAAAPVLFGEDPKAAKEMDEALKVFAEEHGMDRASLAILTDPETEIIIPGDSNRYVLGSAAAGLLKMVINAHKTLSSIDPDVIKAAAEKEVEGKVTRAIASKLKDGGDIRSLGDAASSGVEKLDMTKPVSERDWAKLTPEERKRRLGGG